MHEVAPHGTAARARSVHCGSLDLNLLAVIKFREEIATTGVLRAPRTKGGCGAWLAEFAQYPKRRLAGCTGAY